MEAPKPVEQQPKAKGGRPKGYSPKTQEPKSGPTVIEEDGEHLILKVKKKDLMKVLLKDLI